MKSVELHGGSPAREEHTFDLTKSNDPAPDDPFVTPRCLPPFVRS